MSLVIERAYSAGVESPLRIDLKKDLGLTIEWQDGVVSYFPIGYLRRMSPSADMRQLREDMKKNPLTVLPAKTFAGSGGGGALRASTAELVGNYAMRVTFSDGHSTGIYTWTYLREIDRGDVPPGVASGGGTP